GAAQASKSAEASARRSTRPSVHVYTAPRGGSARGAQMRGLGRWAKIRIMSWINFFVRGACLCALVLSPGCRNASVTFNAMLDGLDVNFRSALPSVTEIETIGCSLDADC